MSKGRNRGAKRDAQSDEREHINRCH
ncbi:hypothetical protein D030_1498A, partial [Vibrio parahaemolyticus AQ3810]